MWMNAALEITCAALQTDCVLTHQDLSFASVDQALPEMEITVKVVH